MQWGCNCPGGVQPTRAQDLIGKPNVMAMVNSAGRCSSNVWVQGDKSMDLVQQIPTCNRPRESESSTKLHFQIFLVLSCHNSLPPSQNISSPEFAPPRRRRHRESKINISHHHYIHLFPLYPIRSLTYSRTHYNLSNHKMSQRTLKFRTKIKL